MIFSTRSKDGRPGLFDPEKPVLVGIVRRNGKTEYYHLPPETRVAPHPSGDGFIATHPDHKAAVWCKFNMTTEVHTP